MSSRKVLIIGGDSAIGAALMSGQRKAGNQVITTTRRQGRRRNNQLYLDIQSPELNVLFGHEFDVAVFCAGVTSVRTCDLYPEFAHRVNVLGTIAVANYLASTGTHVVFLSTNMVFDGSEELYTVDSAKNPITEYGKQKALVEDWIINNCTRSSIIRFGKVLPRGFPLFNNWKEDLLNGKPVTPYMDKYIAPISAEIATEILCLLIRTETTGVFQATALHSISYSSIAYYLASLYNIEPDLIKPMASKGFGVGLDTRKELIGANETLDISEIFKVFVDKLSPLEAVNYSVDSARYIE